MKRAIPASRIPSLIREIESLVQLDEGGRGIKPLIQPAGELQECCKAIHASSHVAILTGFPCLLDHTPPTETDGPLGALSMAKTLLCLGKKVVLLTDNCNSSVLLACMSGSGLEHFGSKLSARSFPPRSSMQDEDWAELKQLGEQLDLVIAIERAGPNKDGKYCTMRTRDMTHLICPLDILLTQQPKIRSIGIGDGGNEVGMGKAYDLVVGSSIPNAAHIACAVAADHLLVASVSNWGGYAISAAASLYQAFHSAASEEEEVDIAFLHQQLDEMLPTADEEQAKCARMLEAGARDGVTGEQAAKVDGMPLQVSLDLLDKFRRVVS